MATLSGKVLTNASCFVFARLYARAGGGGVGFIPADSEESAGTIQTQTDDTGAWSLSLTANSLIEPANTLWQITYAPSNGPQEIYYCILPPGGAWIGDCLVDNPSLPDPTFSSGDVSSVNGRMGIVTGLAENADLDAETAARIAGDATNAAAVTTEANTRVAADALLIPLTQKAANSGVATLDSTGKVPAGQLPSLVLTDTFVVASQAAMLALNAQTGDLAIRTDLNETFILSGSDPTILGNWTELLFPGGGAVNSVNGRTGSVTGLAENSVTVTGGTGLSGGGDLSANRTISMPAVGTAGTYGDATHVVQVTTDTQGRVSGATAVAITGLAESAITNLVSDLAAKATTAGTLAQFASTTSLQLKTLLSDETGSGAAVFATSPALVTPTGIVKGDVGLGNVDNTSDASKPVSTAQQTALDAKQALDADLTAIAGFASRDASHYLRGDGWQTFAQLVTDLGLGSVAALSQVLAGITIPTNALDKWKAGRSRLSTNLVGAISNSVTTIVVKDPSITPTPLHRRLWIENEEVFTTAGEGAAPITGITSVASTGIFTKTADGLVSGQPVVPSANILDSFLTFGTVYFVSATNLTANTFSLAATSGGAVLTGSTNDTNLTLLLATLTVATRGSVNGSPAVSHADKAPVYASKVKAVCHLGDSVVEGTDSTPQANDAWTIRAARMLSDRMGGLVAYSWPMWRQTSVPQANMEYTLSGLALPATNNFYDVGYNGALTFNAASTTGFVWTRSAGLRVQAVDFNWIDKDAASAQWSYSLDGGTTWIDNPVASIYSSGKGLLRRTRVACNDPTTIRIRAATAAGTAKAIVLPWVALTTWTTYPYAPITEGVHWANLGQAGVKLREILNARVVHDAVTDGAGGITSATAAFVANDVNSYIFVNGVQTTISARTNGTTATTAASLAAGSGQRLTILQGSGTGDWMANFYGHHGSWFPDLVIIGPYTNDFNGGGNGDGDVDFYGDMLQWLITQIQPCADILLVAPHEFSGPTPTLQASYRSVMHTIAAANNVALLDLYDAFAAYGFTGYAALNSGGYMQDTIHFTYKGNVWMGSHLTRALGMI